MAEGLVHLVQGQHGTQASSSAEVAIMFCAVSCPSAALHANEHI